MARGTSGRRKQSVADKQAVQKPKEGNPKSMVIRIGAGEVGSSVTQLVQDVRQVMQPDTAVRLKERRANKLRDYTTMAGPLGVTHLLLFSRSESGNTNMRLAKTPHGPTLHFRVEKYSLSKDIMKSVKHYRADANAYNVAPLLVMNNFLTSDADRDKLGEAAPPKHLEKLVTDMFQGLFPPIQPHTTPLHTIKRVLLLNREPPKENDNGTITVSVRHYAITTKITGVPKAIRRLHAAEKLIKSREKKGRGLPNLGKLEDVADYMLDPSAAGYTSASDTEADTDAEVEVTAPVRTKVMSKKERERLKLGEGASKSKASGPRVEKRAVKLVEIGPRLKLRLTKVEEDVAGGKVMWHEFVTKTKEEQKELDVLWEKRNKEKAERRRIQRENIEKKRKERGEKGEDEVDEDEEMEDVDEYDMDDDVWHDEDGEVEEDEDDDE
ncbi:rRNA-binding ribosome biosynthesis protein [Didymosphaeria variabile]|uniref:rRNA-binding ribosome biosynthesis protein n=1 Tax=Didymosphaeria variabile TaxID=1932322 RepID=A0A9W9C903_9PLEO|nr:rRNA-binding ribosome biosynthesis protein [Didymosphaeria variabile]KAJ4350254.1 rRNA-binding ribosome biosynthesis protein [Didymosphaeria variabile]